MKILRITFLLLSNSFAIGCLISAFIGTILSLITLGKIRPNILSDFICKDNSWKMKGTEILSNFSGKHTIVIIVIGFIAWGLLNYTNKGEEIKDWILSWFK